MKKILLSLFSIFMLFTGAIVSGCGGGDQVATIVLESSSFSNENQNLIEMDLTTEENQSVTIKATIENQDNGVVIPVENSDAISVDYEYNASLNTNTITINALKEGNAEVIIRSASGKVEEKKIIVSVYSHITGLSQKVDEENKKKTQYIVMDQNVQLLSDRFLDITARDTCNRKDVVWSLVENYGNSLSLVNDVLRLDSHYFAEYQNSLGEEINQITIQAQSKYKPEIVTPVTLDVLVGVEEADVSLQGSYRQSGSRFDVFDVIEEEGKEPVYNAKVLELVRSENDEKSTLYYFVDIKTSRELEWIVLTDEVLYKNFNIPYGTFDITKELYNYDDATKTHSFVFKVIYDAQGVLNNNFSPVNYEFNFSFAYKDYDYVYSTRDLKINLIDVVKTIEVTNDQNENLSGERVEVYNTYANGKGHFFNVSLTPEKAKDTSYFLRLKVAKETAEKMSSYTEYLQVYTEMGDVISFAIESDIVDDNYVYFKSVQGEETRTFSNGTRVYAVGQGKYSNDFSLCFYSNAKNNINATVGINLVYAPNANFDVLSEDLNKKIESSVVGTKHTITLTCPKLASIDVKDLWLDYVKSDNYEISSLRKSLQEISFDITVNKANIKDMFDITLCHKNGYKATSSVNVEFFKALTQASVSLLKANSSNISYYKNEIQTFGGGNDNSLSELIVTFGSSVELSFLHDADQSLTDDINLYFYVNGRVGVQEDGVENELEAFFESLDKNNLTAKESANYMEFVNSLSTLRFMTNMATSFTGYVVVEFSGYDVDHNPTKIYRIIDVESYVPVSMLSTPTMLVETIASDSLSANDAKELSNESVVIRFRNDPSTSIPITYFSTVADGFKPYFSIYSATATKDGVAGDYVWDKDTRSLSYKGTTIYSLAEPSVDGFKMTLDITANTTSEFVEFVDTLVVEYNSFSSTYRLGIDIKITNSERVSSVIWENKTDDNTLYILLPTTKGQIGENNKQTVITTVSEAYNTDLRFFYAPIGGQSNIITFEKEGKYDIVQVNKDAEIGGHGYVYIIPSDSIKANDEITFSYYDADSNIKTDKVPLTSLNSEKESGQSWFDYLYDNAFYVSNKQEIVRFSDILIRINLIVADGLSEETAFRIYTGEEVKRMTSINHYVLMNDISLTMDESLFTDTAPFIGSLRGFKGDEVITMVDSMPIFAYIGKVGVVKDLVFNGVIKNTIESQNVGFIARSNAGTINNVKIDVYETEEAYTPSVITGAVVGANVGGIAGYNTGKIINSGVYGLSINNAQTIGGIAGNNAGQIENCKVEMYKFSEDTANQFVAKYVVGGIVGITTSSDASIKGSYIYDYALEVGSETNLKVTAATGTTYMGAFVGRNTDNVTKPDNSVSKTNTKIENSFAVIGVTNAIAGTHGTTSFSDIYISWYDGDALKSNKTETTSSLWINVGEDGFKEYVNGGEKHLKFYQAPAIDINAFEINGESDRFVKIDDTSIILYLYETQNDDALSVVEANALKNRNTYTLQELFGLSDMESECVVVSSSNLYKIKTNINALEVLDTGSVTIKMLSKQDFSQTREFNIEIIHIIKDFKATYKGLTTTGIEVQESRSAQIEFKVMSSTYLNSATLFDLIIDDFVVNTDTTQFVVDPNLYAEYRIENKVGTVNVFAGAKKALPDGFEVNNYISLSQFDKAGFEKYNDVLKTLFNKNITITPYEGTNNIGINYSSITLYPSLSSQFGATLFTDSETDALHISMKFGETKLSLSKLIDGVYVKSASNVITEDGEYVFSFGNVEKRIVVNVNRTGYDAVNKKYVYSIILSIDNDYKSSIAQSERYTMIFNSANDKDGLLTKELSLVLESQKIDNIDVTNYKIETIRNNSGKYTYRKSNTSISLMSPGASSIFEVTIDPVFSYYEYLTLSYVPQNAGLLSLTVMNREADGSYTINTTSNVTNIAYGVKFVPVNKSSVYAFRIYVASNISSDCVFPLTVSFYGYNNDGSPKLLEERTYNLYVTCIAQPQVYVNGSEFTKIAKGTSAPVEITLNNDQDLESLTILGTNLQDVFISYNSVVDNGDGTKTYKYSLNTKLTSSINGGLGQFEVRATVSRTLNGVRESKSMSAYVALVEFDVKSVSVLGAEYDEAQGMEVFTAFENITKDFAFNYVFDPESYGNYLTDAEKDIVTDLNIKKEMFRRQGYYSDGTTFWINYNYDSTTNTYSAIDIMNQLYIVGTNNREQKITWTQLSTDEYSYIHYDGSYAKFRIIYNTQAKTFNIVGNSTTSAPVKFRLKNITYLASMGTNIYWESSYDFGVQVKAYIDEDSPETINDATDFLKIKEEGEAKPYILMNDIVLENYTPFDTSKILSLDGNGYTIHINSFDQSAQSETLNLALFTNITSNTILKNVKVNWYNAGQISIDTSSEGFTNIHIAGLAISNSGIIYNCEVVAYYDEDVNKEITGNTGIVVTYTRNTNKYYIDGNSSVKSLVSGLVENNDGNITNSRVGGETLRVITDNTKAGRAYYEDYTLETFNIIAQGEVNGFVSKNNKNIASSKVSNVQITNESTYNEFRTSGFVNTNSGSISSSYIEGKNDGTAAFCYLTTSISSIGYIAGFVDTNNASAEIENCMSNIVISTSSLFGSGFVYKNEGKINYCFSASQVEKSSYTQMGFTGLDSNGNLVSQSGTIAFSYYYDMKYTGDSNLEKEIDTGAVLVDLSRSNSPSMYYGFSFASGEETAEMLENADGIWYVREDGKIGIISPDVVAYSVRYIGGVRENNSFVYLYSNMIDNDEESVTYGASYSTQYGSKYNPIIIENANDFDEAMGTSVSTNIKQFYNETEIFGSYRLVNDINLDELEKTEQGNVRLSSTTKALTTKTTKNLEGVGQIDGNGFIIDNISIASSDKSSTGGLHSFGLFARIEKGAKVLNLDLGILNVTADDVYVVGGLAGIVSNSTVVNVNATQAYTITPTTSVESSDDGILAQNIAGGIIGVAFGQSTVKDIKMENPITQVGFYDSARNTNDYYLTEMNLMNIRTTLITDVTRLDVLSSLSIAGGVIGFTDIFDEDQRTQVNYVHDPDVINYRVKNIEVNKTVNVRGEIVGGVFGYTTPTVNVENARLRLSVDSESGSLISKILSSNSYAGGIVGLGNGYFYRVSAAYDEVTQARIEASYPKYYTGNTADESFERGLTEIFYSTYTGTVSYDYKPQVIGGLIGVMTNGEIDNSYSKINVIAKPESKTIAGGVIGRIYEGGTTFTFILNSDQGKSTSASVRLIEVYSAGAVQGGYVVENGNEYGFGGGIVGILDRNAVLALESVNAVNAFGYEDVVTVEEVAGQPKTGDLSSIGVYAFVGGTAQSRGTIRVIAPVNFTSDGDHDAPSSKSIGYFPYIKNASGEKITIAKYPGEVRVEYVICSSNAIFEIISVSEFADVVAGYNSVLSAFLVGKHWDPTRWEHTSEAIYPEIQYSALKSYYFLDCNNIDTVISAMQNSDVTVYVRGLTDLGTYDDVDLSGKTIVGYSGKLIGPEGWLEEEEIETGIIAKKDDGEFIGINLKSSLFSGVGSGLSVSSLKINYLSDSEGSISTRNTTGAAFINGSASGINLTDLEFNIVDTKFNIAVQGGNAGFVATKLSNSSIKNVEVNISGTTTTQDPYITVVDDTSRGVLNAGIIAGYLELQQDNTVADNVITSKASEGYVLKVNINGKENVNIGGLFGHISVRKTDPGDGSAPTYESEVSITTQNFAVNNLIKVVDDTYSSTPVKQLNLGGQIGKVDHVSTINMNISSTSNTNETTSKIHIASSINSHDENANGINYGGLIGQAEAIGKLIMQGSGTFVNTTLLIGEESNISTTTINAINAGGAIGELSGSNEINIATEGSTEKIKAAFNFASLIDTTKSYPADKRTITEGNIGGLLGHHSSSVKISGVDVDFNLGVYNDAEAKMDTSQSFMNLNNANVGGIVGQNSAGLIVTNASTSGVINEQTKGTGMVAGVVALSSGALTIGSELVKSSINIISDAPYVGGIVAHVDAPKNEEGIVNGDTYKTTISKAFYDGTIQLYTSNNANEISFKVGGIVAFIQIGVNGEEELVKISNSAFGGNIIASGKNTGYEKTTAQFINKSIKTFVVGGIVGEFSDSANKDYVRWYSVNGNVSYGDVIVRYNDDQFKDISEDYTFGGIVGVASKTTITDNISLMTNNNPGIGDNVHAIIGNELSQNISDTEKIYRQNSNKYSSAVNLCVDNYGADIGYNTDFTTGRHGYLETGTFREGNAVTAGKVKLETITGSEYISALTIGSKLNPYVLGEKINPKTPIVYVVVGNNSADHTENVTELENRVNTNNGDLSADERYSHSYNIALIGDGFTIEIKNNTESQEIEQVKESTYAIFKQMQQNDIISSLVVKTALEYDITDEIELDSVGGFANIMNGGIIYASGIYGDLSVGGQIPDGGTGLTKLGGLVGNMTMGRIDESYSAVNVIYRGAKKVTGEKGIAVAGFANVNASHNTYISNSFSTGKVETYITADAYAFNSGTIGSGGNIAVSNCYTISQVDINDHTTSNVVTNTTTTAFNFGQSGTYTNCYYDSDATYATLTNGKGTKVETGTLAKDYSGNGTVASTSLSGWTQSYIESAYFNYGYPTRNFGYLKRTTVVTEKTGEPGSEVTTTYHLIPNAEKLAQVSSESSWNYRLEYDIDLAQTSSYKTGGNASFVSEAFKGIFDGNGKTINGLQYNGLFTSVDNAIIKDLRVTNATYSASTESYGAIAATATGENYITNVIASGNLSEIGGDVGGFFGRVENGAEVTFANSKNYVQMNIEASEKSIGGFVGYVHEGASVTFEECTNYAPVQVDGGTNYAGGLVGKADGAIVLEKCGNTNSVLCGYEDDATNTYYSAGLVGKVAGNYSIDQCYNTAMIKAGHKSNKEKAYAAGIVNVAEGATKNKFTNCLNQGVVEALSSVEDAKTEYKFNNTDNPDNTTLTVYYNANEARDGAAIVRVYADSIATGGENLCTGYVNEGTIFKNGLYGWKSWTTEPIRFSVNGNPMPFGQKSDKNHNSNWKIVGAEIKAEGHYVLSEISDHAVFQIGSAEEASVYISKTDDLGAPVCFYVTVPRMIYYHNGNGLLMTTRKQEIYQYYNKDVISDSTDDSYYKHAKSGAASDSPTGNLWNDRVLAFMTDTENADVNALKWTTINGKTYSVAKDAESLKAAINVKSAVSSVELTCTETIGGETIENLLKAGYSIIAEDCDYIDSDGWGVGLDVNEISAVKSSEYVDDDGHRSIKLNFYFTYTVHDDEEYSEAKFSYRLRATKEQETFNTTLEKSSVVLEVASGTGTSVDGNKRVTIYMENVDFVNDAGEIASYNDLGLTENTTYQVIRKSSEGIEEIEFPMLYSGGKFILFNVADNNPSNWVGATISFNANQNATFEEEKVHIGMLTKDDNSSTSTLHTGRINATTSRSESFTINTSETIIGQGSSFTTSTNFSNTYTKNDIEDSFDVEKTIIIDRDISQGSASSSYKKAIGKTYSGVALTFEAAYDFVSTEEQYYSASTAVTIDENNKATISVTLKEAYTFNYDSGALTYEGNTISLIDNKGTVEIDGVTYDIEIEVVDNGEGGLDIQFSARGVYNYKDTYTFNGGIEIKYDDISTLTYTNSQYITNGVATYGTSNTYGSATATYVGNNIKTNKIGDTAEKVTYDYDIDYILNEIIATAASDADLGKIVRKVALGTDTYGNNYYTYAKVSDVDFNDDINIDNQANNITANVTWTTDNVEIKDTEAGITTAITGSNMINIKMSGSVGSSASDYTNVSGLNSNFVSTINSTYTYNATTASDSVGTITNRTTTEKMFVGEVNGDQVTVNNSYKLSSYTVSVKDTDRENLTTTLSNSGTFDSNVTISVYANKDNGNVTIYDGKRISTSINTGIDKQYVDVEQSSGTTIGFELINNSTTSTDTFAVDSDATIKLSKTTVTQGDVNVDKYSIILDNSQEIIEDVNDEEGNFLYTFKKVSNKTDTFSFEEGSEFDSWDIYEETVYKKLFGNLWYPESATGKIIRFFKSDTVVATVTYTETNELPDVDQEEEYNNEIEFDYEGTTYIYAIVPNGQPTDSNSDNIYEQQISLNIYDKTALSLSLDTGAKVKTETLTSTYRTTIDVNGVGTYYGGVNFIVLKKQESHNIGYIWELKNNADGNITSLKLHGMSETITSSGNKITISGTEYSWNAEFNNGQYKLTFTDNESNTITSYNYNTTTFAGLYQHNEYVQDTLTNVYKTVENVLIWTYDQIQHKVKRSDFDTSSHFDQPQISGNSCTITRREFTSVVQDTNTSRAANKIIKNNKLFAQVKNLSLNIDDIDALGYRLNISGLCFTNEHTVKIYTSSSDTPLEHNEMQYSDHFTPNTFDSLKGINHIDSISIETLNGLALYEISDNKTILLDGVGKETEYKITVSYKEYKEVDFKEEDTTTEILLKKSGIPQNGIILLADVDVGGELTNENSGGLGTNLSGNGYFINYCINNGSFLSSSASFVKDTNIGGVIYVSSISTSLTYKGILLDKSDSNSYIRNVSTYGSITTKHDVYKNLAASGLVGNADSSTIEKANSYVNFSSFCDVYDEESNFSYFSGVVAKSTPAKVTECKNFGTIIGYDGADGANGVDGTVPVAGNPGKNGQDVYTVGNGIAASGISASRPGCFGIAGKGGDGAGGEDITTATGQIGGKAIGIIGTALAENGEEGELDGYKPNLSDMIAAKTTQGCSGWNGLNLHKFNFAFQCTRWWGYAGPYVNTDDNSTNYSQNIPIYTGQQTTDKTHPKVWVSQRYAGTDTNMAINGYTGDTVNLTTWTGFTGRNFAQIYTTDNLTYYIDAHCWYRSTFICASVGAQINANSCMYATSNIIGVNGSEYTYPNLKTEIYKNGQSDYQYRSELLEDLGWDQERRLGKWSYEFKLPDSDIVKVNREYEYIYYDDDEDPDYDYITDTTKMEIVVGDTKKFESEKNAKYYTNEKVYLADIQLSDGVTYSISFSANTNSYPYNSTLYVLPIDTIFGNEISNDYYVNSFTKNGLKGTYILTSAS